LDYFHIQTHNPPMSYFAMRNYGSISNHRPILTIQLADL
jgi:hypothetical protein